MALTDFHVLVIGAGSCGLALAQGLRKSGVPYTIFERDSAEDYHQRPRDWGSLLHWGQQYMEKCLPQDLWERRSEMYVDPWDDYDSHSAALLWNAKTGEEIKRPDGDRTVRLSRRKIRILLSEGLNMEYSKRLSKISTEGNTVTAHFQDGTSATGSLLVACDGGRSKSREFVVGPDAAKGFDSGYTFINTWSKLPAEVALGLRAKHPIISQAMHPDISVGALIATLDVPYQGSPPNEWRFQVYTGWKGTPRRADLDTPEKAMQFFKQRFEYIVEPFHSVGKAFPDSHILPVDDGWNFKPVGDFIWDNQGGKVTLAGDAAHSMLPHRGQGLNNAIMDAGVLADAIPKIYGGEKDLKQAIEEYESEMRPRGTEEVELTLQQMRTAAARELEKSPLYKFGFHRPQGQERKL